MMGVVVQITNNADMALFSDDAIKKIAYQAINRSAKWARTRMDREIRNQVNLPASYLRPSEGRLTVYSQATADNLEAVIQGRDRPTMLAQFVKGGADTAYRKMKGARQRGRKAQAIRVGVKKGHYAEFKGAFVVKLRGGEKQGNTGLAIRMRDGTKPSKAYAPTQLKGFGENVWLLYGPSVDQILWSVRNNGGVFAKVEDDVVEKVNDEFARLLNVEMNRGR